MGYWPVALNPMVKYSPIFKTARVAKKNWRKINTIASIWDEFMLGYFPSLYCPWPLSVSQFSSSYALGKLFASRKRSCPRTNSSWHIFAPHGGYYLHIFHWQADGPMTVAETGDRDGGCSLSHWYWPHSGYFKSGYWWRNTKRKCCRFSKYDAFSLSKFNLLVVFTYNLRFSNSVLLLFSHDIRFSTSTFALTLIVVF